MTTNTRIDRRPQLISLAQIEEGERIQEMLEAIYEKSQYLDPSKYRLKTARIGESDLTTPLLEKINALQFDDSQILLRLSNLQAGKASKEDLANYRRKDSPIRITDMDERLIEEIMNNMPYDDSELRKRTEDLLMALAAKVDEEDLTAYRRGDVLIGEHDITEELMDKIAELASGYNDSELRGLISGLDTSKADKKDLDAYRKGADPISEADLDESVRSKINAPQVDPYDDKEVRELISGLDTSKADKKDLDAYRKGDVKIDEDDLSQAVVDKISQGLDHYDDKALREAIGLANTRVDEVESSLAVKADASALSDYRRGDMKITEADLSDEVKAKMGGEYDDSEIRSAVAELDESKADKADLSNYRKADAKILEGDLEESVKAKLGQTYDDTALRGELDAFQDLVGGVEKDVAGLAESKADKATLADYRKGSDAISEEDLDENLRYKVNNGGSGTGGYDDTVIRQAVEDLRDTKADKSELKNYRPANVKINEAELDADVQSKINRTYDDSGLKNQISLVSQHVDEVSAAKADKSDLTNYRPAATRISEDDLAADLQAKINAPSGSQPYDDSAIRGQISDMFGKIDTLNFQKADRTQLADYRSSTVKIFASDLDEDLLDGLKPYDDAEVLSSIGRLFDVKADKQQIIAQQETINQQNDTIQQLLLNYAALEQRVRSLEPEPPDAEPVIVRSNLDQATDVYVGTTQVVFLVSGDKGVKILDASKITSTPSGAITKSEILDGELVLTVKLAAGVGYAFTVGAGALANGNAANSIAVTSSFTTQYNAPVVDTSSLNGSVVVPNGTTQVKFPVTGTALSIKDASKIKSTPDVIQNRAIIGGELVLTVAMQPGTAYTFTVEAGAIKNGNTANTSTVSASFTTLHNAPVISNSALNTATDVPVSTTKIRYAVTGTALTVADASKITSSPMGAVTSAAIEGSELVLTVALASGTAYTFTVGAGSVKNGQAPNAAAVTTTLTTVYAEPQVSGTSLKPVIPYATASGDVKIQGTSLTIVDPSKIYTTPDNIIGTKSFSSPGVLAFSLLTMTERASYKLVIEPGAVRNGSTANTWRYEFDFVADYAVPVVSNSALNGQTAVPEATTQVRFAVSGKDLSVADASKITTTPAGIVTSAALTGSELVLAVALSAGTSYSITVGAGAVRSGTVVNTASVTATFTTQAGSTEPVVDWTYDFILPNPAFIWNLKDDPKWTAMKYDITNEDVYGPDLSGANAKIKLYYQGPVYTDNRGPTVNEEVPRDYFDSFPPPNSNGQWSLEADAKQIWFKGGDISDRYYRLVKMK